MLSGVLLSSMPANRFPHQKRAYKIFLFFMTKYDLGIIIFAISWAIVGDFIGNSDKKSIFPLFICCLKAFMV
jgi:hypothetical protein